MVSRKDRRHSGWYTPETDIPKKLLKESNIEIPEEYDDWNDRRDSFRDWFKDSKMIKRTGRDCWCHPGRREAWNKKQEMLLERRKARKLAV